MRITLSSEYGWSETTEVKSLLAAKRAGTRALAYGCGNMTLETPDNIYLRRFVEDDHRYRWEKWELVA